MTTPDAASLDRLHDIVAPAPLPLWPPAPAWFVFAALVLLGLLVLAARLLRAYQRNHYRREALAALAASRPLLADPARRPEAVAAIGVLLKRAALVAWPRERVASLTGDAWLAFLDSTTPAPGFVAGPGRWLETAAYDPRSASALDEAEALRLADLARRWLAEHRLADSDGVARASRPWDRNVAWASRPCSPSDRLPKPASPEESRPC